MTHNTSIVNPGTGNRHGRAGASPPDAAGHRDKVVSLDRYRAAGSISAAHAQDSGPSEAPVTDSAGSLVQPCLPTVTSSDGVVSPPQFLRPTLIAEAIGVDAPTPRQRTPKQTERSVPGVPGLREITYSTGKVSLFYKHRGSSYFVGHKGVHSHVEMMARIHDIQQAVKNGRNLKAGETTCDTFVETVFKPWALKNIPGSARDVLSRWWLYWSERLGSLPLRAVTEHHINQAVSAIRSGGRAVKGGGHTVGGANRIAMAGRTIFRAARDLQYIDTSPADGIRNLREDPPSPRALTEDELERLGVAIDNSNDHDRMVEVTLRTGCRIGEVQILKPEHIDRAAGVLHIPATKSGVAQTVAADKRTFEILDMQMASRRAGNPYVFQGAGARPAAYRLDLLHRLFDKAGLPHSGYHVLRKTWATQAMSMGVDLLTISRHLRHQSVRTTERHYIATPRDRLRTASEAVGAMFSTRLQAMRRPQLLPSVRSVCIDHRVVCVRAR